MSPTSTRSLALGVLSGGLLALAFPGTGGQGWLAFGALVPLLVAIEGVDWRRAGVLGFAAGVVFWLATIPWVAPTMVRYGGLPWPLAAPIVKDSVDVAAHMGSTDIEFTAANPGDWFFHCHKPMHMEGGMITLAQIV